MRHFRERALVAGAIAAALAIAGIVTVAHADNKKDNGNKGAVVAQLGF
jgi:uncharacterized membrane protein